MAEDQPGQLGFEGQLEQPQEEVDPLEPFKIKIRKPAKSMKLEYDQQYPPMELPPDEVKEKIKSGRVPFGFNYDPERDNLNNYTLRNLVSSKQARDIVRSSHFMPGQFEIWNSNPKGGNNKYTGRDIDLDGDRIPEFVVKKGDKIVAVNGYTTKTSDFPFRRKFYEAYPEPSERSKHRMNEYLSDEYYKPIYNDDYSAIDRWDGVDPTTEEFMNKYKNFRTHKPTKFSTYRAIAQLIAGPACKAAFAFIAKGDGPKAKIAREVAIEVSGKKAFETSIAVSVYDSLIKIPFMQSIADQIPALRKEFAEKKLRTDPDYHIDWGSKSQCTKEFEQWLFSKKSVKDRVIPYAKALLSTQRAAYVEKVKDNIIKTLTSNPEFVQKFNDTWAKRQKEVGQDWALISSI